MFMIVSLFGVFVASVTFKSAMKYIRMIESPKYIHAILLIAQAAVLYSVLLYGYHKGL